MLHRFLIFFLLISGVLSCTTSKKIASDKDGSITISSLNFLDEYVIPHNLNYNNTIVGGLSGIDYDAKQNRYFIISDERSYTSPARFYTARINLNGTRIDSVIFTSVNSLKQPGGDTFPSFKQNAQRTPDPESIRYNPLKNNLTWTSEGDREVRMGKMIYQSPYVYEMDLQGNFQDSFFIPHNLQITPGDKGPRENGVLEGSTFADNYKAYYVSMESPLYEDGPVAMFNYKGAPIRVTKFDTRTHKPLAQYAYLLDALAYEQKPSTGFFINGVDEIMAIGNDQFLFIERSFSVGYTQNTIKIFLVDIKDATNVATLSALHLNKNYRPVSKKLLLNLDELNRSIDNIEGMTLGPLLPNGNRSLILIADNNFQLLQKSQVLLFEIIP